jgi:CBS domain-containing protein
MANDRTDETESGGGVRVEDVMTSAVASVTRMARVRDAARVMRDRDIGFLPVCEADGTVVGVVTDRDLVLGVLAADKAPTTAVEDVMTPDPIVCYGSDDLAWCERLMSENGIDRMVVVGDDERLAGVISLADLVVVESQTTVGQVITDVKLGEAERH